MPPERAEILSLYRALTRQRVLCQPWREQWLQISVGL